ncbi:hypothetical protein ACA910_012896 [Epithemia clementina (nom. ined.)]
MATCCLPLRRRRGINRFIRLFRGMPDESFRALVQTNAFSQIQYRLETGPSFSKNKVRWLYKDMYEQGPLHFILPYRPPLSLVESILLCTADFSHVPEEALDSKGRTPLHIAAAYNCSFQIIRRLLSGVSLVVPALTRDDMDRLPLHWACCHPFLPGRAESENKFDTIILLLDAYPQAVDMADANGRTPLDYALQHRMLDRRITDLLQKVSARQREQKIGFQKAKAKNGRSFSPRAASELMEQASSKSGCGVPLEINAKGSLVQREARPNSRSNGSSVDDDISSLGWDRVSIFTPNGRAPANCKGSVATRSLSPTPSPQRQPASKVKETSSPRKEHNRLGFPLRAKSLVKGCMRRWAPRQKQITVTKSDPGKMA